MNVIPSTAQFPGKHTETRSINLTSGPLILFHCGAACKVVYFYLKLRRMTRAVESVRREME